MTKLTFSLRDAAAAAFHLTDTRTDKEFQMTQTHSDTWEFETLTEDQQDGLTADLEARGFEFELTES